MVQLPDLPNELLRHLLSHVMPEDLENFAQVSKHIRSVSGSALEEHRQFIQKYTSFSGPVSAEAVEPLLKEVLTNSRIGHYVKSIELCEVVGGDSENEEQDEQDGNAPGEKLSLDQIHAAVNESKLLNPRCLQRVYENVDMGKKHILIALLLPLLPNLNTLSISDRDYLFRMYKMLERASKLDARFLSKLEYIHIQDSPLDHVTKFLLLPSLRKISGLRSYQNRWRRELLEPPQISNVTDLELRHSVIGSKILDQFLRHFPHLEYFVYTSFYQDYAEGDEFNPFIIRAALQARVSTTLRRLTILTDAREEEKSFMGPLCGFKVLEYVHSEWGYLIPRVGANVPGDDREILSLILPKSLRVLRVRDHDDYYESNHEELIDHAIQAKTGPNMSLPLLETLMFTLTTETACEAKKECALVPIENCRNGVMSWVCLYVWIHSSLHGI